MSDYGCNEVSKRRGKLSRRRTLLCQMCHMCPCPIPSPAPTAPAQHSPAPTHIPYTQHLVNTPSPYTHTLVHTAHSPCTSLCLPHTPNPDHIYTQYNPIYAQLAFLPTPSPVHAPNLPLTCKPPDSSSHICPGDMFLKDFTALHMLLCDVAVFSRLLMIMDEICPCLLYRRPSSNYRNG